MEHLDLLQRYQISAYLKTGKSYGYIAKALEVSKSTISREIRRNQVGGEYSPNKADLLASARQRTGHIHRKFSEDTWIEVNDMIRIDFSPEQVSGRLKLEGKPAPSTETIYKHVWMTKSCGSNLYLHLRRKCHKYHKRGNQYDSRGMINNRRDISERPAEVEFRNRFGDIEIDTVIGKNRKGALLTMNDRATGIAWIRKLNGKNSEELATEMIKALRPLKKKGLLHTITSDNGKEFAQHEKIARRLKADFYFARPYCSNDRASNENMNGLIRQYVPKGTSMERLTDEEVREIETKLNTRPRKRLDFKTPEEYLFEKFNLSLR
jgi:IS30 family transposase